MTEKIIKKLQKFSDIKIFVIFLLIGVSLSFLSGLMSEVWDIKFIDTPSQQLGKITLLITGVIIAPLFETWLFYYLPFHFLKNRLKLKHIAILAALIFGVQHFYSVVYIIYGIAMGWAFAIYYLYYFNFNSEKKAFLLLSLLHAAINFTTIILSFFG